MPHTVPLVVSAAQHEDAPPTLYRKGVREDYAERFPDCLQTAVTWFTGKPRVHELDVAPASPARELMFDSGILAAAMTLNVGFFLTLDWLAVPLCILLALVQVGRLRKLQVAHGHEAAHGDFFPPETRERLGQWAGPLNEAVLGLATTIPLVQNGKAYRIEHGGHHRFRTFTTGADGDAAFMQKLGFKPGMSVSELWRRLARVVFSVRDFHGPFLWARLRSNLIDATGWRRAGAWIWLGILASSAAILPPGAWLLAVFLPWVPAYQVAALGQFACEHAWLKTVGPVESRTEYASRCWARWCGAPLPDRDLTGLPKLRAWMRWAARMALVEVPVRVAVLPSVLMAHDAHHLAGWCGVRLTDWPNTIFHRERVIQAGDPYGLADRELWGLVDAITHTFEIMSRAKSA